MQDAVVRARVSPDLKADAEKIFATLGIDTTSAIRMFLSQVRLHQGLPFAVGIPGNEDLLLPVTARQAALDSLYED
ncbi:MAG: putative DNA protein [Akkermansiaceae bacterium]|nr:putative DNA protein [Akkermansiaceae bacterium]